MVRWYRPWSRDAIRVLRRWARWSTSSTCWHRSITVRCGSDWTQTWSQVSRQRRRHDIAGGEVPVDRHARRAALGVERHVGTDNGVDRILGAAQLALAL